MAEMGGCAHETLRTAVFLILNFKLTLGNIFFFKLVPKNSYSYC